MVKFMSIITRIASRCLDMGNFHIEVSVWPDSLAATLRGAARVIMQQVNAIGMKQINVGSNLHPVVVCLISIGTLQPVAIVFAATLHCGKHYPRRLRPRHGGLQPRR